jgi:hypothetical protein
MAAKKTFFVWLGEHEGASQAPSFVHEKAHAVVASGGIKPGKG